MNKSQNEKKKDGDQTDKAKVKREKNEIERNRK